ncbi:MAG: nucleotidyltransferase family protein [Acidobacteriota bacterium]
MTKPDFSQPEIRSIEDAVVLAGGRGRRMGSLTETLPKPLLEVDGRAILLHILEGMARAGVRRAHVVVGYQGERIESLLEGADPGLETVVHWQKEPRGTADALLSARGGPKSAFLLSWGDVILPAADYAAVCEAFRAPDCDAALGVNRVDDPCEGAAVYVGEDLLVERIVEKPPMGTSRTPFNNSGLFALPLEVFDVAARVEPSPRGELELPAAFQSMLASGVRFRAVELCGWTHVGTPDELQEAQGLEHDDAEQE